MNEGIECSCSIDMDGDRYCPKVFNENYPTANKIHRCCECSEEIQVGETYERVTGLWDDQWATFRTCTTCQRIRNEHCCTWVYGELREAIWESMEFDYVTGEDRDDEE